MEIVGYSIDDLAVALDAMEASLKTGEKARVRICSEQLPSEADLAELYVNASMAGFHLSFPEASIVDGIPTTELVLTKGSPQWQALIPIIPTVLVAGLITFGIIKIEEISKAIMPILLVVIGGAIVIVGLMRRPAERVIERAAQKYLPETEKKALTAR